MNSSREKRLALFREGLEYVCEAVERFSRKHHGEGELQALRVGMDRLIHCTARYNPEQGPFANYLRASLRYDFKKLERWVARFSELARRDEEGELVEYDPPAQVIQQGEFADATLAGLEGPGYTDEERDAVWSVYRELEAKDPELALVFRLGFEEGVSLQEIGHKMGYSPSTAWRRKKEARRLARQIFRDMGLYDRPIYRRDWGPDMVDHSLLRPYEEMPDRQFPPGWKRHFLPDENRHR